LTGGYNGSSKNMSNLQNPPALNSASPLGFWDSAFGALSRELSPQQFKTWIHSEMIYSCAYWKEAKDLESAQIAKLDRKSVV